MPVFIIGGLNAILSPNVDPLTKVLSATVSLIYLLFALFQRPNLFLLLPVSLRLTAGFRLMTAAIGLTLTTIPLESCIGTAKLPLVVIFGVATLLICLAIIEVMSD